MSARALGIIAVIVIGGGLVWFALRDRGEASSSSEAKSVGSASLTPTFGARTTQPTPKTPTLPELADRPSLPTPEASFASEARDDTWASQTESEIRRRFKSVRGAKLDQTECKESRCRILIAGSEAEIGKTIADLESDRGLHGYAENIVLTAPEKRADGSLAMRAFVVFKR